MSVVTLGVGYISVISRFFSWALDYRSLYHGVRYIGVAV